jgi:hypothetical protein
VVVVVATAGAVVVVDVALCVSVLASEVVVLLSNVADERGSVLPTCSAAVTSMLAPDPRPEPDPMLDMVPLLGMTRTRTVLRRTV